MVCRNFQLSLTHRDNAFVHLDRSNHRPPIEASEPNAPPPQNNKGQKSHDLRDDIIADDEKRKDHDDDYDDSAVIDRRPLFCVAAATLSTFHPSTLRVCVCVRAWVCGCSFGRSSSWWSLSLSPTSENGRRRKFRFDGVSEAVESFDAVRALAGSAHA